MAVEGADGVFAKHLEQTQEQIDRADILKAEKVSAKSASKEVLDAAIEKRTDSEVSLKAAGDELSALEAVHQELYKSADLAATTDAGVHAELANKEEALNHAKKVLDAFTELLERQSVVPTTEPVAVVAMEDKLDVINKDEV